MAEPKKHSRKMVRQNVVEALKDMGADIGAQTSDLLQSTSEDFFRELVGFQKPQNRSGEIKAGEELNINEALAGHVEENKKLKLQISFERNLASEEMRLSGNKLQELRVRLQAISAEIARVAVSTGNLATQAEIAMIQAPSNPGVYHVIFFEKILEFLQSYRKNIDEAVVWLQSSNKRSEKKNYWSMYKKKGSSFLLSPDHYLQRSAG